MNVRIYSRFLRCLLLLLILLVNSSPANSIYSRHGIGLLRYRDSVKAIGMGGVGMAIADSVYLSFLNPANLAWVNLTRVQGEFLYERTEIDLQGGSGRFQEANVYDLGMAIPLKRGYVMAFGIEPYSRSEFEFRQRGSTASESYEEIFRRSGGINELYITFAMSVGRVQMGITGDFYFGVLQRTWRVNYGSGNLQNTEDVVNYSFSGVGLHLGLQTQLGKWLIGTATALPTQLNIKTELTTVSGFHSETIAGKLKLPVWWGIGLGYVPNRHWVFGADWRWQRWSTVSPEELLGEQAVDSYELGFGAQAIPSVDALDGYFKRINYRLGGAYRQLPYEEPVGSKLREWVATFGLGLPFGRGVNRIDLAVEIGKRGTLSRNIAEDNIVLFHASINGSERWFQRGPKR